jgi:hypothetical protein
MSSDGNLCSNPILTLRNTVTLQDELLYTVDSITSYHPERPNQSFDKDLLQEIKRPRVLYFFKCAAVGQRRSSESQMWLLACNQCMKVSSRSTNPHRCLLRPRFPTVSHSFTSSQRHRRRPRRSIKIDLVTVRRSAGLWSALYETNMAPVPPRGVLCACVSLCDGDFFSGWYT